MYRRFKRNLKILWLRFRINCFRGSVKYADSKLLKRFDPVLYKQRKIYLYKIENYKKDLKKWK